MTTRSQKAVDRRKRTKKARFTTLEESGSVELVPNIPDHITIEEVSTKLPWSTIRTLPLLNSAWQHAVHNREVFEARVRSGSTEKLVVMNHALSNGIYGIAVYSLRDEACFSLPPIPNVGTGIPESCQCITLDGKIFVLGGLANPASELGSKDVYMLDVAGQRQWKKCASMQEPRLSFGCALLGGKIYVFGGISGSELVRATEAYDPQANSWTTLTPIGLGWIDHEVGVVNDELMVYGGRMCRHYRAEGTAHARVRKVRADHVKFYNPVEDQWRNAYSERNYMGSILNDALFVANGKLHCINRSEIFVYDFERDSRTHLHSMSTGPSFGLLFDSDPPVSILAVDDELLALEYRPNWPVEGGARADDSLVLLRSKGFGSKETELLWKTVGCSLSFSGLESPFLRLLRL